MRKLLLACICVLVLLVGCTRNQAYTIEVKAAAGGFAWGSGSYRPGETAQLEAVPHQGYLFVAWVNQDGQVLGTEQHIQYSPTENQVIQAVFESILVVAQVLPEGGGKATIHRPSSNLFTVEITPSPGYVFCCWREDDKVVARTPVYKFIAQGHTSLAACLEPVELNATASPAGGGSIQKTGPTGDPSGYLLTAKPNTGYSFSHWEQEGQQIGKENPLFLLDHAHYNITAVFSQSASSPDMVLKELDGSNILIPLSRATTIKRYVPGDLKPIPLWLTNNRSGFQLRQEVIGYLTAMGEAAKADGVKLVVTSAYRSYEVQAANFQNAVRIYGSPEQANRYVARPGQSEHQLGTTVDFGATNSDWKPAFADTAPGNWLKQNAHRFGFVMSFPRDKEKITGYVFEPWHFRYVGVEVAQAIIDSGLTPLEYLQALDDE